MNNHTFEFQTIDWKAEDCDDEDSSSNSQSEESDESDVYYSSDDNENKKKKFKKDTSKYKITVFGKDAKDNTITMEITDFTPHFYIRLPDCPEQYDKKSASVIKRFVKDNIWAKYRDCLLRVSVLRKHSFRNFDNNKKYRFARIVFSNLASMKQAVGIFQKKEYNSHTETTKRYPKKIQIFGLPGATNEAYQYDLYENHIDPLIKFIHYSKIKAVGWVQIKAGTYEILDNDRYTTKYTISTRWTNVKPLDNINNSNINILAYDIECDSAHGDFPVPNKDYTKLAREIYNCYMKKHLHYTKLVGENDASNKRMIDEITSELENREDFAKKCIKAAFTKDGSEELEISQIFTKLSDFKPSKNQIKLSIKNIATYLTVSNNTNSIERKKHSTRCINRINKILNESFPEVAGDQTIQIGMSFMKYGSKTPYINYMLTYDPTGTCDKINANTESYKTEKDLLLRFRQIIINEDPEIITGWNTDGFDTPWLFKRADELNISYIFNKLSRDKDYESVIKTKQVKGPTGELIMKEFVEIPGRIQMDMLPLVQKSYNLDSYKLDNVSATFINGKIKDIKFTDELQTQIFTNSTEGLNEGNYIVFSEVNGYLENKYEDGKKFQIKNVDHENNVITIEEELKISSDKCSNFNWCLGKDDVSPQDIFELQKKGPSDRAKLAYYCMMDVVLCHELLNKLSILTNNIGMANVCLNPLSWIIHRGQGIKILSLTAFFLKKNNYLLPYLYKDTFDKDGYEGAVVLNPNPGIYINKPVAVLDYGSLYPSSMIERNLSHEMIVSEDDTKYLGDEGAELIKKLGYFGHEDITYDVFKTRFTASGSVKDKVKVGQKTVRFVQYSDPKLNDKKGLIPEILRYLLKARKTTRNKIKYKTVKTEDDEYIGIYDKDKGTVKTPEDTFDVNGKTIISVVDTYNDFQKQVLDGLQLAFKMTANSLYGQIGAKTSDIYYKEIAAATTATGRERLIIAQEYAENERNYPHKLDNGEIVYLKNKVVYGDTDSVFVHYQTLDGKGNPLKGREARKKSIELAIYTEKEIQKTKLRLPQVLEYEKTFDPFILLSKKRYVGNLYEIDPDKYKLKSMGIVLKRRDNAPIVKVVYGGIIDRIMKNQDILPAIHFLKSTLRKLVAGKFGLDTLILSKTLSSYYKDPDRIAHKVLADRMAERDPGNKPQVNDRIPFIYIDKQSMKNPKSTLQGDKIEHPDYIIENKLKPDYEFYITNQIMKPVSQIFGLCLDEIPGFNKDIKEFDNIYAKQLAAGKSINESIKKMQETKSKEAGNILFQDILRVLENKRNNNTQITDFFRVR